MKYLKICLIFLLLFLVWVGLDRSMNIKSNMYNEEDAAVWMDKSVWVNIPDEQWIEIDHEQFEPVQAFLNVEGYNSLFNNWGNTISSSITYAYRNEGDADFNQLYITEYIKPYEFDNIHQVIYEELIDDIQITFGSFGNMENVLQFQTNDKTINIRFYKGDINKLKPLFESIFEDTKKI